MDTPVNAVSRIDFSSGNTAAAKAALAKAGRAFEEHGCFVALGMFAKLDLEPVRREIQRLIQLRRDQFCMPTEPETDAITRFDDGFLQMNRLDRTHGGVLYNACRRLVPVQALTVHPRLLELSRELMKTRTLMESGATTVRIDHAREDTYLFPWHQDYPYIQDSLDGVVYWIPLQEVDESNGWLKCAVGSHKDGVVPVRVVDPKDEARNKARNIEISDLKAPDRYSQVSVPLKEGDALVFSTLLLHCSQPNRSTRARWTVQIRHGNFEHSHAVSKGWPGTMHQGYNFDQTHPEFVSNLEDL